jgi:hypothetical protein
VREMTVRGVNDGLDRLLEQVAPDDAQDTPGA